MLMAQMSRFTPAFLSNIADDVSSSEAVPRNFLIIFAPIPAAHMELFGTAAYRSILLGPSQNLVQSVSLGLSFRLHYFLAPPEHFLEKRTI
jgi:hypothetical protein